MSHCKIGTNYKRGIGIIECVLEGQLLKDAAQEYNVSETTARADIYAVGLEGLHCKYYDAERSKYLLDLFSKAKEILTQNTIRWKKSQEAVSD